MEIQDITLTEEHVGRLVRYKPKGELGILVSWNESFIHVDYFTRHTEATRPEDLEWDSKTPRLSYKRTPYKVLRAKFNDNNKDQIVFIEDRSSAWKGPWYWGYFVVPKVNEYRHDKVILKKQ